MLLLCRRGSENLLVGRLTVGAYLTGADGRCQIEAGEGCKGKRKVNYYYYLFIFYIRVNIC